MGLPAENRPNFFKEVFHAVCPLVKICRFAIRGLAQLRNVCDNLKNCGLHFENYKTEEICEFAIPKKISVPTFAE
jgi:hypothetical protein